MPTTASRRRWALSFGGGLQARPAALGKLNRRELTLLALELSGFDHIEKAALLDVSHNAARKAWTRTRAKLRAMPKADAAEAVYWVGECLRESAL